MISMEEKIVCRKALDCTSVTEIKEIGKYLFEIRCKWRGGEREGERERERERASKTQPVLQMTGVQNMKCRNVYGEKRKCQAIVLVLV